MDESSDIRQQRMAQVEAFSSARIVCVGDVMLDRFVYGDVSRISPEAPIPVMRRLDQQSMLGGAGNVVRNVVSLGASAQLIGVVGADATGRELQAMVQDAERLSAILLVDESRCSSEKTRFVCAGQQLLRCDEEEARPINDALETQLLAALKEALSQADILILSDYAKGVLSPRVIRGAIELAKDASIPVFIDPKQRDIALYAGADLLSPNAKEMAGFVQEAPDIMEAGSALCSQYEIGAIALTRGKDGISLLSANASAQHFPAQTRAVYDVSGAGDTVMATLAVAHAVGATLAEASELANVAAGIAVSRPGTATVFRTDLKAALYHEAVMASAGKLASAELASAIVTSWRQEGKSVGFTNGCFDLLHVGHLKSLKTAKDHCDKLVVAINSDASVRRLKGESRPVNHEMDRADLLGGLACVDLVVIFREDTPEALIRELRPDVLMKGEDYQLDAVVGAEFVQSYGGAVKLLPIKEGYSSSKLLEKQQSVH